MKAKLKLDGGALKTAFVKHIEKILFAGVALCFAWLVYSAMNVQRYTKTPDELVNVSRDTRTYLENQEFKLAEIPEIVKVERFDEAQIVDPEQAASDWKAFLPSNKPQQRRKQPLVLAPTSLRAQAGIGAIATNADEVTRLERERQRMEFQEEEQEKQRREMERNQPNPGAASPYGPMAQSGSGRRRTGEGGGAGSPYGPGIGPGAGGRRGEGGGEGGRGRRGPADSPYGPSMSPYGATAPAVDEEPVEVPIVSATPDMILKGERWVCITGLVPGKKQFEEYKKALGSDPQMLESPQYLWFEVQRAEFKPGKAVADTDWQDVDVKKALKGIQEWATQYPEVADTKDGSLHPMLAMPLPPLVTRNWGAEVVHEPEIEKLDPTAQMDQYLMIREQLEEAKKRAEEGKTEGAEGSGSEPTAQPVDPAAPPADDWEFLGGGGGGYGGGGEGRGPSPYGPSMGGGHGGGSPYGPSMGGGRSPYGPSMGGGRSPYGPSMGGGSPYGPMGGGREGGMMTGMSMTPPDHFLLRFFDFSVESGKSYVYRVRLRVRNPNWGMLPAQLESPSLRDEPYILGEWSGVTDAARVPGDTALVAGEPKINRSTLEPSAKVVVAKFNADKGVMATVEESVTRGQIANFFQKEISYIDPVLQKVEEFNDLSLNTDLTVVDILGGATVGKNSAKIAPGRMLLMDSDGNFEIREELTDRTAFNSAIAEQKRVKEAKETGVAGAIGGGASPYGPSPYGPSRGPSASPYGPALPRGGGESKGGR